DRRRARRIAATRGRTDPRARGAARSGDRRALGARAARVRNRQGPRPRSSRGLAQRADGKAACRRGWAMTRCYWLEPTDRVRIGLRRYRSGTDHCPGRLSYHNALVPVGEAPARVSEYETVLAPPLDLYAGDPRWPTHCACGVA